jgi:uncharacterized membrane protein
VGRDDDVALAELRRWIVAVVLGLLILGFVAEIVDAWFFGDRFHLDAGFYGLVGGVIIGAFGIKVAHSLRSREE